MSKTPNDPNNPDDSLHATNTPDRHDKSRDLGHPDRPDERELARRRRRVVAESEPYKVGYAKPDPAHQFKPGNKIGARPRKKDVEMTFDELMRQVGQQLVSIKVDGKRKRISKNELFVRTILNGAMKGEPRSMKMYADLQKSFAKGVTRVAKDYPEASTYAAEVRQKLEDMARRIREEHGPQPGDPDFKAAEGGK